MYRQVIVLVFLVLIAVGTRAESDSDPAAVLEGQTRRRRQDEISRLAREQTFDRSQFSRKLERFDRKAERIPDTVRPADKRGLRQRLNDIRTDEARNQTHREQELRRLELGDRNDPHQRRDLERLRHRQRADAFVNRQKLRLRRNQLNGRRRP